MKKGLMILLAVFLTAVTTTLSATELKVGDVASDWQFKDANGKIYSMESWKGKVLLINYTDPDEADLNEHFTDAMKKARNDGRLTDADYKGIGIADCAATWKPDFAIRAIAGRKAKKYNTVILFDYDAVLRNAWGLAADTANVILLDKDRVCRAIVRGRVPDDQVEKLVQLAVDLQTR